MDYIYAELRTGWLEDSSDYPLASNYVEKSNESSTVYGVDESARQVNLHYTYFNTPNTIVYRDDIGSVRVVLKPVNQEDATSKNQKICEDLLKSKIHSDKYIFSTFLERKVPEDND